MLAIALLGVTIPLLGAGSAGAKACGGDVPCACGDTVVASTTLSGDLGICDRTALRITKPVVLDCAGHTITGNDQSNAKFGIEIHGVVGATVRDCRVTRFRRGIRIDGGSGNTVKDNESFANKYGIDLAGGTMRNVLKGNLVYDSRDEGIHLGESHRNRIVGNEVRYNKRENLYLLRSNGNLVKNNLLHHGGAAALFVKHSSRNRFVHNTVRDTALQLRGDSRNNAFENNYLKGEGYMIEAWQEPDGWTRPTGNTMTGDCIRKADVCFRFVGASDNVATEVRTDGRCAPPTGSLLTLTDRGGQASTGNVVTLAADGCFDDPF